MVVTSEGDFYVFGIDLEKGGEGTLLKAYSVLEGGADGASGGKEVGAGLGASEMDG